MPNRQTDGQWSSNRVRAPGAPHQDQETGRSSAVNDRKEHDPQDKIYKQQTRRRLNTHHPSVLLIKIPGEKKHASQQSTTQVLSTNSANS